MEDTTKKPVTLAEFPLSQMTLEILEKGGKPPRRPPSIPVKQTSTDPSVMAVVRKSKEAKSKKKKKKKKKK